MTSLTEGSIFKEQTDNAKKMEGEIKRREPTKEDFVYKNIVTLCGKIIKIYPTGKDGICFILSCGHGKTQRKNKDGLILRDTIPVCFYEKEAKYYGEKYKVGDFVVVNALVQNVRGREDDKTAIWGLAMGPKYHKGRKKILDQNTVIIRGKIDRIRVLSNNYLILNVKTDTHKTRPNVNPNSNIPKITDRYMSITPIGIRFREGNAHEEAKKYTKGTWVDCKGYIDDFVMKDGRKKMHVMATNVKIIGQTQQ